MGLLITKLKLSGDGFQVEKKVMGFLVSWLDLLFLHKADIAAGCKIALRQHSSCPSRNSAKHSPIAQHLILH